MTTRKEYNGDQHLRKQKLTSRTTKESIDKNGESNVTEDVKVFSGRQIEPPFVKLYISDIELLYRLKKNSGDLLFELLNYMNYEGEITVNKLMKERICAKLEIKNIGSIGNYLTQLVKKDIFQRIGQGVYLANPYLFAKGDWSKNIKGLRVSYKENGRDIKAETKNNKEDNQVVSDTNDNENFPFTIKKKAVKNDG
ncbi:replication/maintenance protein RepL [Colwellia sp. MB3u-55]|uniref:replication/maintenance protein RepL n=1 Tax=Colwellia sp. MB3u-55 TaxID=2759810 RepID=UPI0015F74F21|nr:replication/maintenance protein RepL [Colwellia sp. MB3u-55]MBA6252858.1 replication/maintenance protein RepL [Colwellia sp. MB3u-55]